MQKIFKENIILILGISLPLLLTALFFIATQIEKTSIAPPEYSVVFAQNNYSSARTHKIIVKDERVHLSYIPREEHRHDNASQLKLYIYSPKTKKSKEVSLPETNDLSKKIKIIIPDLSSQKISTSKESPDGYAFTHKYSGNHNLMTEIFGGGARGRSHYVLKNGAQNIKIPNTNQYNTQFIGWVIPQ